MLCDGRREDKERGELKREEGFYAGHIATNFRR